MWFLFFIGQGFLPQTLTIHRTAGKGGDHLLFYSTTFYFVQLRWLSHISNLTRLLLDEIYNLIELPFDWLIDDAMFVFLLDELILGFVTAIWYGKPVDVSSHRLSPLYYKRHPPSWKKSPKFQPSSLPIQNNPILVEVPPSCSTMDVYTCIISLLWSPLFLKKWSFKIFLRNFNSEINILIQWFFSLLKQTTFTNEFKHNEIES